nr:immunoglobulin heavy chain junction region [Macaca mulatta]MOW91398.1 immunoglobulin heavy chain junction region [Macaca mulatta]
CVRKGWGGYYSLDVW